MMPKKTPLSPANQKAMNAEGGAEALMEILTTPREPGAVQLNSATGMLQGLQINAAVALRHLGKLQPPTGQELESQKGESSMNMMG